MRILLLAPTLVAVAFLAACDAPSSPTESRIEIRSASMTDDSMLLHVAVDGHDREVHIADVEGTRAVAVVASTSDEPLVTLVSEAEPECVTEDTVACELTEAALDGTLDELAADADDGFRLAPVERCFIEVTSSIMVCWTCESQYASDSYCVGL
jgi:hypothetical protein